MKIRDKANYFTRYLMKKQHQIKASILKQDTKTQSTEKIKHELNPKKTEETSTTQGSSSNQVKKRPTHKKGQSAQLELIMPMPIQTEENIKQSIEEIKKDDNTTTILPSQDETQIIPQDMTDEHINFFKKKINNILSIIDEFERENNLNQDDFKNTFIYELEPKTERIINKININDFSSPPNSDRIIKTNRNPSIASKDSTNYFTKNQNIIFLNSNLKGSVISNIRLRSNNKTKQIDNSYSTTSIKKNVQRYSRIKNDNRNFNCKNNTHKPLVNRPRTQSDAMKAKPKELKVNQNQLKENHTSTANKSTKYKKRNGKKFYANKYFQEHTSTPNENSDNNTFMSDLSINLVLDDNMAYNNNQMSNTKKPLIGIPIKNFLKIREQDASKSKCQSDRNKSSHKNIIKL